MVVDPFPISCYLHLLDMLLGEIKGSTFKASLQMGFFLDLSTTGLKSGNLHLSFAGFVTSMVMTLPLRKISNFIFLLLVMYLPMKMSLPCLGLRR